MATYNLISKNQNTPDKYGAWLVREVEIPAATYNNADVLRVFELPDDTIVLDGFFRTTTAGGGTSFAIDQMNLENEGGSVDLISGINIDLKVLGTTEIPAASHGVRSITGPNTLSTKTVSVSLVLATSAESGTAIVLVALYVLRLDYSHE